MCVMNYAPREPREAVYQEWLVSSRFEAVSFQEFVDHETVGWSLFLKSLWPHGARMKAYNAYLAKFRESPLLVPEGLRHKVEFED